MNNDRSRPGRPPSGRTLRRNIGPLAAATLLLASSGTSALAASYDDQFLFFPAGAYAWRSGTPAGDEKKRDGAAELDLFYTADIDRVRLLAEVFGRANGDDELEIERLQAAWKIAPESRIWLGRFHNPIGYWNTEFHHGTFLQTSISRPALIDFEDDGGVLPMHLTGALLEGAVTRSGAVWRYDVALGVGPEMNDGLHALEIHRPGDGGHHGAAALRLSWQAADSRNSLGLFAGWYDIPGAGITPADINQRLMGLFAHLEFDSGTELLTAVYDVENELSLSGTSTRDSFRSGHLQLEQDLGANLALYARGEGLHSATADPYLNLFGALVRERQVVGLRYELARNQAIKIEFSKNDLPAEQYDRVTIQWSAVYP